MSNAVPDVSNAPTRKQALSDGFFPYLGDDLPTRGEFLALLVQSRVLGDREKP